MSQLTSFLLTEGYIDVANEAELARAPVVGRDIWGFIEDTKHLIEVIQEREAVHKKLVFTQELGSKRGYLDEEVITWEIVKRTPGTFDKSAPGTGIKMRKPILVGTEQDRANPQYAVLVLQQWYDNFVRFGCWSRDMDVVNVRLAWFENLMLENEWYYRMKGYRYRYEGLGEMDTQPNQTSHLYYGKPLIYWIRSVKTFKIYEKTLDSLKLELSVNEGVENA